MNASRLDVFDELLGHLQPNHFVVICLDFDGTLVAIQEYPEKCWISLPQRDLLRSLATHPRVRLAIVTGRALDDIRTRIGIPEVVYAANHGLEIQGGPRDFLIPRADEIRASVRDIAKTLSIELQHISGCWVENKGLTASVHYRSVAALEIPHVSETIQSHMVRWPEFLVRGGKAVFEIRPKVDWNKCHAVKWIATHAFPDPQDHLLIYSGDDTTDQDVFLGLPDALTIEVGDCPSSSARYGVSSPDDLWHYLQMLEAALYGEDG